MTMKKKEMIIAYTIGVVIIVLCGLASIAFSHDFIPEASAENASEKTLNLGIQHNQEQKNPIEGVSYVWHEAGYDSVFDYWNAVEESRSELVAIIEEGVENYRIYMNDGQYDMLLGLLEKAKIANSLDELEDYSNRVAEIIAEVTPKMVAQGAVSYAGNWSGAFADFMRAGVVNWGGNKYTYYSQSVLPGGGLNIPGRHVDGGFVKDADGYIVIANSSPNGTIVDTPFGPGKVYDKGTSGNHYDIYVE